MKQIDLTLPSPAENLAADEALLEWGEAGPGGEVLRFWEPRNHFVVVGYANKAATEVNLAACEAKGVPVFRRCSGGGTVVQGPGCLNYTLVLRITETGPLHSIGTANQFIMRRNRTAIQNLCLTPQTADARPQTPNPKSPSAGTLILRLAIANSPATRSAAANISCSFTERSC